MCEVGARYVNTFRKNVLGSFPGLKLCLVLYYPSFGETYCLHFGGLSWSVFIRAVVLRLELTSLLKVKAALDYRYPAVLLNLWNIYNCTA
jgi:hypothetical protein